MRKIVLLFLYFLIVIHCVCGDLSAPCETDADCGRGVCKDNKCDCDEYFFTREKDGKLEACNTLYGQMVPSAVIGLAVLYCLGHGIAVIVHVTLIISMSISNKRRMTMKAWQLDRRFCIICLAIASFFQVLWVCFWARYMLGHSPHRVFTDIYDINKVCYFEAAAAVCLYWFTAVHMAQGGSKKFLSKPWLVYTLALFLFWFFVYHFKEQYSESVRNITFYIYTVIGLLILIAYCILFPLFGVKITKLLTAQNLAKNALVMKIRIFLFFAGVVIFTHIVLVAYLGFDTWGQTIRGYTVTIFLFAIDEFLVHIAFMATFSGGSFTRIAKAVIWVWKGKNRTGHNPMDEAHMLKDRTSPSTSKPSDNSNSASSNSSKLQDNVLDNATGHFARESTTDLNISMTSLALITTTTVVVSEEKEPSEDSSEKTQTESV